MYYLLLYFSILFTVQVILILEKAPVLWLLAIWSFLLCAAIFFRQKLLYPSDHPHFVLRKQLYAGTLVLLVCLIFSNLYVQFVQKHREESWIKQQLVQQEQQEMAARITGKLTSPPMHDGNRVQFTLEVAKVEGHILALKEKVLVQRYAETEEELSAYQSLKRGTLWSGEVQLKLPEPARNPGAFDYRQHLFQQGIHSIGRISNNNWQAQQNRNWQTRLLQHLDHQRERWSVQVQRIFSDDVAPIILAMTIGDRNEIDPDLLVSYQQLGLIHLLAISGLHVGIIVWCLYALLLKFTFTREKVLMFLFCLLPVYIYISEPQFL
ncbi:ComEC/Rec2 family competence protein [Caldalkalibacillus mannanilyticus]|uniref:ComEC/Rec2 family competence protein n=1 Tax=Caldalkalibacillus mannanilyticus TaxID=1418 RepID=UPI000469E759|nr:ComEC/Rec2 family competence protein [Caldalkalibacillus mannanilyticus]